MLGRQVGTSLLRLPGHARLPIRCLSSPQCQYDLAVRTLIPSTFRSYAQITPSRPGRPRKAVGEPSRPVKRDVKKAAKSPKEDAATQKTKAKAATAQTKKKTVAAKPAPKKKVKKVSTEEEKAKKAEKLAKSKANKAKAKEHATILELKRIALEPPPLKSHTTAWNMFIQNKTTGRPSTAGSGSRAANNTQFTDILHDTTAAYKNMPPAEKEHYNHLAQTQKERQAADYKKWVESHSVEDIHAANNARARLRRKYAGRKGGLSGQWDKIKDERHVKKPTTPFALFSVNRYASGDFKGIKLPEAAKLVGQEWKALDEGEKKKYIDLGEKDKQRYIGEYTSVFGHAPEPARKKTATA